MKLIKNRKKLNNKGFTLIELLAVIVILAIVMGIAASSVISIINNSRKSGLQDSAAAAADAFRTAYAEMSLSSSKTILGIETGTLLSGTSTVALNTGTGVADALNITGDNYDLTKSFVHYDSTNNKFTVCLVAQPTGSYYVGSAKNSKQPNEVGLETTTIESLVDEMWACSDNQKSW